MTRQADSLMAWLSSEDNPPVRYLASRDLRTPPPAAPQLTDLRDRILVWPPLQQVLELQQPDGGFGTTGNPTDSRRTFWALLLMRRCGLDTTDEPVARAIADLHRRHASTGAISYTNGGSGVLPCYLGVVVTALIEMGALDTDLVQSSIQWLADHQRFDHKATRAGGDSPWPYRAPETYGCWQSVSCFQGVAGAFRALAAIPPERRSASVRRRLDEALEYLRIHRLYQRSGSDRPLVKHLTQSFLVGDYRSDLLDLLQGVVDADPGLIHEDWIRAAVDDMRGLTDAGRVTLVKNYAKRLIDPVPFEPIGEPSRFLTYQWTLIQQRFDAE